MNEESIKCTTSEAISVQRSLLRHFTRGNVDEFCFQECDGVMTYKYRGDYSGPMHVGAISSNELTKPDDFLDSAERALRDRQYIIWVQPDLEASLLSSALTRGYVDRGSGRPSVCMCCCRVLERGPFFRDSSVCLADDPPLIDRFVRTVADAYASRPNVQPQEATNALFRAGPNVVTGPFARSFVLDIGSEMRSAAMYVRAGSTGSLCWVSTTSAGRGRGLAARVVRACQKDASQQGVQALYLQCADGLVPFYEKLGFHVVCKFRQLTKGA